MLNISITDLNKDFEDMELIFLQIFLKIKLIFMKGKKWILRVQLKKLY